MKWLKWLFKRGKKRVNITIIPTVVNDEGIWSSDIKKLPKDVPADQQVVYVRKGTSIGEWTCTVDGYYPWELIKNYKRR